MLIGNYGLLIRDPNLLLGKKKGAKEWSLHIMLLLGTDIPGDFETTFIRLFWSII